MSGWVAGDEAVGAVAALGAIDAKAGGGVALRIEVDEQHVAAEGGKAGGQIYGGGGFADAAFLVGDRDDAAGGRLSVLVRHDAQAR
jgi:hypothetical protein